MAQAQTRNRPQQRDGNGGGQQLTVQEQRKQEIKAFGNLVDTLSPSLGEAAAKGVDLAKLKRIAMTAVNKNPDLLQCSQKSWITALMQCAQDGLMPDGREAAFVKFKGEVVYMPMVYGLRKKILQSGEIRDIFTAVVYAAEFEAGLFEVELGSSPRIVHKPLLGNLDRGEIIAAYSVATYKDGTRSFEVMTRAEIERVRAVSRSEFKNGAPWHDWYGEMARKTVLRRHSKALPMSSDIRDVEVDAMFGEAFNKAIGQRDEDRQLTDGRRTMQLPASETRTQLDDIEAKAGASVDVPHDEETGEVRDEDADSRPAGNTDPPADPETRALPVQDSTDWEGWLAQLPAELGKLSNDQVDEWNPPANLPPFMLDRVRDAFRQEVKRRASGPQNDGQPTDEQQRTADDLVAVSESCGLLMDLRSQREQHQATIDGLPQQLRERVIAAFDKREGQLRQRPRT